MITKVVDRVFGVVSTNFNADFDALRGSVPALNFSAGNYFKRLAAEIFSTRVPAGIGVYQDGGATSRQPHGSGGKRDTRIDMVLDWWISGTDPAVVAAQTEVAIQALLRSIDRLPDGTNIVRAAEEPDSIRWEVTRVALVTDNRIATERALIRFPAWHRETGL